MTNEAMEKNDTGCNLKFVIEPKFEFTPNCRTSITQPLSGLNAYNIHIIDVITCQKAR
jgi:hypothetical protein